MDLQRRSEYCNLEQYRLCTFQILIENQLVRRLAKKDYSADNTPEGVQDVIPHAQEDARDNTPEVVLDATVQPAQ
ncbi:hypothetical protein Pcinc_016534 [Petrolisthes cinctipes]|uniref:Uncharacterized protein n=1 Tax=Petrolisthes cinctipes TaxID=88211 RepID=A0AAE1KQX1_PETCI|nr:hypothetical protein Pcinc_016534 [Petrolisthes cinctipes]